MSVISQKATSLFWQILKNRSKYTGDISEQSVVCTVLISAIIIEIFRKNIPISYIIPYKNLASPLIPVCLKKSHMVAGRVIEPATVHIPSGRGSDRSSGPGKKKIRTERKQDKRRQLQLNVYLQVISTAMRTRCFIYFRKTGSPFHDFFVVKTFSEM